VRIKERFLSLTAAKVVGTTDWRGVSIMSSGTTVVSVAATRAKSGAVILTQAMQMTVATNSANPSAIFTVPASVGNGSFIITTIGSVAPPVNMPVAWAIIQ
jgi:hypothetical protein